MRDAPLIVLHWATLVYALRSSLVCDDLPGELHEVFCKLVISCQLSSFLYDRRRADVLSTSIRRSASIHRADGTFKLILLECFHSNTHSVPCERVGFVYILLGHLGRDEPRVSCVGEDVGIFTGQVLVEVFGVQNAGKLATAILPVGSKILVQVLNRVELGILGRALVRIGCLVDDSDGVACLCGLLDQGQEVRGEDDMSHVVSGKPRQIESAVYLSTIPTWPLTRPYGGRHRNPSTGRS